VTAAHITMGLQPGCGSEAVKSKWRELAGIHHPDRGGSSVKFSTFRKAYVLVRQYEETQEAKCPACLGQKKVASGAGFNKLLMPCQPCKGTGLRGEAK